MTPAVRRFRAFSLGVLVLIVGLACTPGAPSLTQGAKLDADQSLRVLLDDQPASLDPGQTQYTYETAVLRAISEPLLRPNPDLSGVSPAAAASFDVSPNGTIYAFHLRRNAEYWDGTPVRAQDFVFAWQRLIDPRLASPSEAFFADAVLNGDKVSILDPRRDASKLDAAVASLGLKATDDYTFQVTLSHPDPAFIWLAAMPAGAPIRQDVVKASGDKWATTPKTLVTNGPFKVAEMVAGDHINVIPNPHYWGPHPTLTSIDFVIVNDGAAALAKYESGQLDVIDVQPAQAAGVAADATLSHELMKTPSLSVFWLAFQVTSPPLNNVRVRRAIAEAIDRSAFVAQVFQGQAIPAESFIPQGMHGYSPGVGGSVQNSDVASARASLASSGVSARQLSGIKFSYDRSSDFQKATAAFVKAQLKANLGIDITLQGLDTNTLNSRLASGSFQIAGPRGWTADYPDASDWYPVFLTTSFHNVGLYQNLQYDNFVRAASVDLQPDRRDQEYQQAQAMLVSDAPVAFLAQTVSWDLVRPYVKGITPTSIDEWPGALFPTQIYIAPR
ncbi:MAG TPA: peptide ABC transporter substrate-binding protein [Candidatus Micrarchaeaceae archaeon]|nr:peptide ABC transporter substrate-binding protein [Candidatus Micrarchaeaceae archaeon]